MKTATASMTVRRKAKGIDYIQVKYIASNAATETDTDTEKNMPLNQIPLIYWSVSTGFETLTAAKPYLWRAETVMYSDGTYTTTYNIFNRLSMDATAVMEPSILNVKLRPNKYINVSGSQTATIKMYYNKEQITATSATIDDEPQGSTGVSFSTSVSDGAIILTVTSTADQPLDQQGRGKFLTKRYCTVKVVGKDANDTEHMASCRVCIQGIVATTWDPINVTDIFKENAIKKTTINYGENHGLYAGGAPLYVYDQYHNKINVEFAFSLTYASSGQATILFKRFGVPTQSNMQIFIAPLKIGTVSSSCEQSLAQEIVFSGAIATNYPTDIEDIFG